MAISRIGKDVDSMSFDRRRCDGLRSRRDVRGSERSRLWQFIDDLSALSGTPPVSETLRDPPKRRDKTATRDRQARTSTMASFHSLTSEEGLFVDEHLVFAADEFIVKPLPMPRLHDRNK